MTIPDASGAQVIYLPLPVPTGPGPGYCHECGEPHSEPGERCAACRGAQELVPAAFVQSTVADAIARLGKIDPPGPMVLPLQQALSSIRRSFDALEPLIHSLHVGIVRVEENEFWAYPYPIAPDSAERLGPFGKHRHAERALVEYALANGDWDTETEWL